MMNSALRILSPNEVVAGSIATGYALSKDGLWR